MRVWVPADRVQRGMVLVRPAPGGEYEEVVRTVVTVDGRVVVDWANGTSETFESAHAFERVID